MTQFDPYRKWLGIPPEEQPPNHYRLLGIGLFESDPDVVSNAADRQMVHVRSFQSGKYSDLSQRILNELSVARVCLLDAAKKAAYDQKLRAQLAPVAKDATPPELPREDDVAGYASMDAISEVAEVKSFRLRSRQKKAFPVGTVVLVIAFVVLGLGLLLWKLTEPGDDGVSGHGGKDPATNHASVPGQPGDGSSGKEPKTNGREPSTGSGKERPNTKGPSSDKPRKPLPDRAGELMRVKVQVGAISTVAFAMIGEDAAFGGTAAPVQMWDLGTREKAALKGSEESVVCLAFAPNGSSIAAGMGKTKAPFEGKLAIWKLPSREVAAVVDLDKSLLAWSVQFSPSGKRIAVGCQDGSIRLFDVGSGKEWKALPVVASPVRSVAFAGNDEKLISGGADGMVRAWDVKDGQQLFELTGHKGVVAAVAVSLDGSRAVSGGEDGLVRLWDLKAKRCLFACKGHKGAVTGVAYAADGTFAISSGADGTLRLWRAKDGGQAHQFEAHDNGVTCVALSGTGRHAISGGWDGTVKVWGMPDLKALLTSTDFTTGQPLGKRDAEPSAEDQAKREKQIVEDVFKAEFEAASKPNAKPEVKKALAEKLLGEGGKQQTDPSAQFVLLRLARDMAAEAGETDVALEAVHAMEKHYEIDGLTMKTATLERMAAGAMPLPKRKILAQKILATVDEAMLAKRVDVAVNLAKLARDQGTKASEKSIAKQAAAKEKELEQAKQKFDALKVAEETLAKTPDDPEANLLVGKHACFVKGDWKKGLACLRLSSDADLKALAEKELAVGPETAEQLAVGDAWWDAVEKQSKELRAAFRGRAAWWYRKVAPDLTGLDRAKVDQRLKDAPGPVGDAAAPSDETP